MKPRDILHRIKNRLSNSSSDDFPVDAWTDSSYQQWFLRNKADEKTLSDQKLVNFAYRPLFSIIVPLYKTPIDYLAMLVESVLSQTYKNFELVLVNASPESVELTAAIQVITEYDERVRELRLQSNQGIAANTERGIRDSKGEYVCFLDHDDFVEPNLLFEYVSALNNDPTIDMLYCDEDMVSVDEKDIHYLHPLFKPDFSPERLLCTNYILHFLAIRKSIIDQVEIADRNFEGTQDYANILEVIRMTNRVLHVSKVLYHWRMSDESTAANPDAKPYDRIAARRSIQRYIEKEKLESKVIGSGIVNTQNLWFDSTCSQIRVSIIVSYRNAKELDDFNFFLKQVIDYPNLEIISVYYDTEVSSEGLFEAFNEGVSQASGSVLLFMCGDSIFQTPEAIEQMVGFFAIEEVGIVSPKTLYSDGSVRCYGVAITADRIMPLYRGYPDDFPGYECNLRSFQNTTASSFHGLMIRKCIFDRIGGFDASFESEIGSADLCKRVRNLGYRIVQTSTVKLQTGTPCPAERYDCKFNSPDFTSDDLALFDRKWPGSRKKGDPYFNSNLDQSSSYFQIRDPSNENSY